MDWLSKPLRCPQNRKESEAANETRDCANVPIAPPSVNQRRTKDYDFNVPALRPGENALLGLPVASGKLLLGRIRRGFFCEETRGRQSHNTTYAIVRKP